MAIGDLVLDLSVLEEQGKFDQFQPRNIFNQDALNPYLSLGRPAWKKTREVMQHLLNADTPDLRDDSCLRERVFHRQNEVDRATAALG